MKSDPGIGPTASAPWYRVVAIPDVCYGGTAERDYAAVLPALLDAAQSRRPFVTGWLSRGDGAPLELFTNAGLLPSTAEQRRVTSAAAGSDQPARSGHAKDGEHPYGAPREVLTKPSRKCSRRERCEVWFRGAAGGGPSPAGRPPDLGALVGAPCRGRQAAPLPADSPAQRSSSWSSGGPGSFGQLSGQGQGGAPWLGGGS